MKSLLGYSRRPDISFHRNGRIDITARVAHKLNLQAGDVIDVAFDRVEFYLYVRQKGTAIKGRHEAQCWPTKRGSHNFRAHSSRLCRNVLALSGATDVARLPIGELEQRNGLPAVILIVKNNISTFTIPISYDQRDKI